MHLVVFFFLFSIHFSDALNCIDGFTSINNKCLRLISSNYSKEEVRRQCNLFGGNPVSIHNSIDNNAVAQFAFSNSDPIWIGLKCSADNLTSCFWDDQLGNFLIYSNFVAGNPSMNNGQCVYMLTTGSLRGKWYSGQCDRNSLGVVCETDPIGQCSHSYGGYCYYPLGELTTGEAQSACAQNCNGNLVSIHSYSENNYIQSIFQDPSKPYIRIGADVFSYDNISWFDGSPYNYTHVGFIDPRNVGSCFSMALVNEVINPGLWLSSNCTTPLPSICKWLSGSSCLAPTLAPPQCDGAKYVSDNEPEIIYSPNYPYSYTATETSPCYYIYSTSTSQAAIWFGEFDLDPNSSFEFYSGLDIPTPFATLNQSIQGVLDKTIISSTKYIKLVFKPCTQNCDQSRNYKWSAISGGKWPILNNTFIFPPGVFTSPNYPDQYSTYSSTQYLIASRDITVGMRVKVEFTEFSTNVNDVVRVYDGPSTAYPLMATLSGNYTSGSNLTFIASTREMCITFTTNGSVTSTGFLARFYDYP